MSAHDDMVVPAEAARLLGIAKSTMERMRREKRGPAWIKVSGEIGKPGGQIRYRRSDIENYLQSRRVEPGVQPVGEQPYDVPLPGLENGEIDGGMFGGNVGLDPT